MSKGDIITDEPLKALMHGLLLGCLLPILAYNVYRRKGMNNLIYGSLLLFEVGQILSHLQKD